MDITFRYGEETWYEFQKEALRQILEENPNRSLAARKLGLGIRTVQRWAKEFNLPNYTEAKETWDEKQFALGQTQVL